MFEAPAFDDIVALALAEDLGVPAAAFMPGAPAFEDLLARDVTSMGTVGLEAYFRGRVVARQECVVAGLIVAASVFERVSEAAGLFEPVEVFPLVAEGSRVAAGTPVAEVEGLATAVLTAERTALDFLMVLSGIATETARWVDAAGSDLAVYDTRKTLPGLRALSKYAVTVGGGNNHRAGLYDMVLVKDNHIRHAGGITSAVARARDAHPDLTVEVEADSEEQALEAIAAGADIVLLDNMDDATLTTVVSACREAAGRRGRDVVLEASGGIGVERLPALSATGVDRVSSSRITMAESVDFGLDEA